MKKNYYELNPSDVDKLFEKEPFIMVNVIRQVLKIDNVKLQVMAPQDAQNLQYQRILGIYHTRKVTPTQLIHIIYEYDTNTQRIRTDKSLLSNSRQEYIQELTIAIKTSNPDMDDKEVDKIIKT